MKSRSSKRQAAKVAEKTSGQAGPFPFHRAGKKQQEQMKEQAALFEREQKGRLKKKN